MKDILELARINGFRLVRDTNHYVLRDGVSQLVFGKTPSDHRAIENNIARIKRACRVAGREFIEKEVKQKSDHLQPFNPPRIEVPKVRAKTEGEGMGTRLLDDRAVQVARELFNKGAKQGDITAKLIQMGYQKPRGGPIGQGDVSRMMIKHGMRYSEKAGWKSRREAQIAPPSAMNPVETPKNKPLDEEALEICRAAYDKGTPQTEILKVIQGLGYTQKKSSNPVTQSDLSQFMVKHGMRRLAPFKKSKSKTPKARVDLPKETLDKVAEISMSNLADKYKLDFIIQVVKDYERQARA